MRPGAIYHSQGDWHSYDGLHVGVGEQLSKLLEKRGRGEEVKRESCNVEVLFTRPCLAHAVAGVNPTSSRLKHRPTKLHPVAS